MSLWLNSTLGIVAAVAARVDTRGAWIDLKKPIVEQLIVPNPADLDARQRRDLLELYREVSERTLLPLPQIAHDPVRADVDRGMMAALGFDVNLDGLRRLLAEEPIFYAPESLDGER